MTMKRFLMIAALCAALPWSAGAQVEKRVEVTKAYVPSVESAAKLPIAPDMTDTTRLRPEIDYSVTPLSLRTPLELRPIRPATVTYWEFNRPLPFYLKVGAGYPLNSVLDFYASTQNAGTGYALGYVNHEGRYADVRNDFGVKNNSLRMTNRAGLAAGKYLGRHVLEGELSYENRLFHRYGAWMGEEAAAEGWARPGVMADYGDADLAIRIGDDFQDLSRLNFEVLLRGGLFFDHSEWPDYGNRARQTDLEAQARIARAFGRHRFSIGAGYERLAGQKAIDGYCEQLIRAGLRYGLTGGFLSFEVGADFCHDRIAGARENGNYLLPYAHFDFNLGTPGLRPFLEIDGQVHENSYRALTRSNPYLLPATTLDKSSVDYNGRFGIGGTCWHERFDYRLYAAFSVRDNHIYWYGTGVYDPEAKRFVAAALDMRPVQARQTVTSFHGEMDLRPASRLVISAGAHGYLYNNDSWLGDGSPAFEANLGLRYSGRKIAFGVSAAVQSERTWSLCDFGTEGEVYSEPYKVPWTVDVRAQFDWKVSGSTTIFAEGFNLANSRLCRYPWYREYGIGFTVGVKLAF